MVYRVEDVAKMVAHEACEIGGLWMPARPLDGPWIWRVKAAWGVLRGRYDAIVWPGGQ